MYWCSWSTHIYYPNQWKVFCFYTKPYTVSAVACSARWCPVLILSRAWNINYCSHQWEYQIWREKKKRNLSTGKRGFYPWVLWPRQVLFVCFYGGIYRYQPHEAALSRHKFNHQDLDLALGRVWAGTSGPYGPNVIYFFCVYTKYKILYKDNISLH